MQYPNAAAVAFLFLLSPAPALIADVLVLDRAAKTVSRLDTPSLTVKASTPLPDVPARVVLSPDGATAVVLCRGEGDDKHDGSQARTKAQAILLEAATLKERARVELELTAMDMAFAPHGNIAAVLCSHGHVVTRF